MSTEYFFVVNGKRGGPVSTNAIRDMAIKQELNRKDRLWCKGMKEWQSADSVPGLFDDLPPDLDPEPAQCSEPPPLPEEHPVPSGADNVWTDSPQSNLRPVREQFMGYERQVYLTAWPIGLVFLGVASYQQGRSSSEFGFAVAALLGVSACLLAVVTWMKMHYRLWTLVPPRFAKISAGQAVGFYFIPLWNVYWCFVTFNGLASSANQTLKALNESERCNESLALAFSVAQAGWLCLGFVMPGFALIAMVASYVLWIPFYADLAKAFEKIERHARGAKVSATLQHATA